MKDLAPPFETIGKSTPPLMHGYSGGVIISKIPTQTPKPAPLHEKAPEQSGASSYDEIPAWWWGFWVAVTIVTFLFGFYANTIAEIMASWHI